MKYQAIAQRIIELKNTDLEFRELLIQKAKFWLGLQADYDLEDGVL